LIPILDTDKENQDEINCLKSDEVSSLKKKKSFSPLGTIFFYGTLFLIFLAPILKLVLMSLKEPDGTYGLSGFIALFHDKRTVEACSNTLLIALGSTCLSTMFGTVMALILAFTNITHKRLLEVMTLMPFIVPSYIISLSWSGLLTREAAINQFLTGMNLPVINLYSRGGIIAVLGLVNTPMVYLSVVHYLRTLPLEMDWASRACGFNPRKTLIQIDIKEAMPAIISGALLAFLASIDNFAVPAFLGISSGITVLSTYIYEKAIGFGPDAFSEAAVLSVLLSFIAIGGTLFESKIIRKHTALESVKEDYTPRILLKQSTAAIVTSLLILIWSFLDIIPLLNMVKNALVKSYGMPLNAQNLSWENFSFVFSSSTVLSSIQNSLMLAGITCTICLVTGTLLAYWKIRMHSHAASLAERCAALTYALPGIVLALSMIFHWVEPLPGFRPELYGTVSLLVIAYVTRYLILQIKGSSTALLSINPELEDAVRACGRSQWVLWKKILVPLLLKPVIASTSLIFVSSLTELTLSSILAGADTKTIGLTIFNFQQAGDYNLSSAMSTVIVLMVLGGYLAATLGDTKKKGVPDHDFVSRTRHATVRENAGA
jgi:iron(III) transport system permease protein